MDMSNQERIFNYFNHINVVLTKKCNLDCNFCRVSKNKLSLSSVNIMSFLSDYQKAYSLKILKFLGGEPLLEWELLVYILNTYSGKVVFEVNTNGHLLDKQKMKFLNEISNCITVISFDYEKWQIEQFLQKLRCLGENNTKNIHINILVAPDHIKKLSKEINLLFKLDVGGFRFIPVFYKNWSLENFNKLRVFLKKLSILQKNGIKIENRAFAYDNNFLMNNQLTVDSDGSVYFFDSILLDFFDSTKNEFKITNIDERDCFEKMNNVVGNYDIVLGKLDLLKKKMSLNINSQFIQTNTLLYQLFRKYLDN